MVSESAVVFSLCESYKHFAGGSREKMEYKCKIALLLANEPNTAIDYQESLEANARQLQQ